MRRIDKYPNSEILTKNLKYPKDRESIHDILFTEQNGFCAYTETRLPKATNKGEIDHFNPNLKNSGADGYSNWFLISGTLNRNKGRKWIEPILHPSSDDFENRVMFDTEECLYFAKTDDIEAKNVIDLLSLNNENLRQERRQMISFCRDIIKIENIEKLYQSPYSDRIEFRRAVEETFKIS